MKIISEYEKKLNQIEIEKENIKNKVEAVIDRINNRVESVHLLMKLWDEKNNYYKTLSALNNNQIYYEHKIQSFI